MEPNPLDLPVQKLEFVCRADRPVSFWPWNRQAEPLELPLARALGHAPSGRVYTRIIDDFDDCPRDEFELEITLWGRRAIATREEIRTAVRRMGEELHDPAPFICEERDRKPARTLKELADDLPRIARRLTLTLETPLDIDEEPPLCMKELAVDAARRLARFDLEDRGETGTVDPTAHAEEAARRARAALGSLRPGFYNLGQESFGEDEITSIGWMGHCDYERPGPEAWPWLLALALGRAGRGRREGYGAFSLWVQAGP
jgi:hypothetical protein